MRYFALFFVFGLLLTGGCSTAQHIRKSDYYNYEWDPIGMVSSSSQDVNKTMQHHPIYAGTEVFKEGEPSYKKRLDYFLWGALPTQREVRLSKACKTKDFRQAYVYSTFPQAFISFITLGIYTPREIEVWCD